MIENSGECIFKVTTFFFGQRSACNSELVYIFLRRGTPSEMWCQLTEVRDRYALTGNSQKHFQLKVFRK